MESKLEEYRLRKRRQQRYEQFKGYLQKMLTFGSGAGEDKDKHVHFVDVPEAHEKEEEVALLSDIPSSSDEEVQPEQPSESQALVDHHSDYIKYTLKTVYFLLWATCYVIAIELQFGIVFLMLSALLGIYFNTRTGPKKKHEVSAYSVFNKNFESIDGTLKAEQFEREIRYGATSVK